MDPATLGLETATAATAALSLFLSRLDARHRRSHEAPDLRSSLIELSRVFSAWKVHAKNTNDIVLLLANGESDIQQTRSWLAYSLGAQGFNINLAKKILLGTAPSWKSIQNVLRIYGSELLAILEVGIVERAELIEELTDEISDLPSWSSESTERILMQLESTWHELKRASAMLDEYVRCNLPLSS